MDEHDIHFIILIFAQTFLETPKKLYLHIHCILYGSNTNNLIIPRRDCNNNYSFRYLRKQHSQLDRETYLNLYERRGQISTTYKS